MADLLLEHDLDRLMGQLSQGDRSAFDPLFEALYPRALRVAQSRLNQSHAEDVAQSSLLRLFARASEFVAGRPLLPWFYAIVANEIRAVTRSREYTHREVFDPVEINKIATDDDPEVFAVEREMRAALAQAIESLDDNSADAIRVLLGESERPMIESFTFRKRISRAYTRLRLLLGGAYGKQ